MEAELLKRAKSAKALGNKAKARELLRELLALNPRNEEAWWLLAQVVERRVQAIYCLQQLLGLNPQHVAAKNSLAVLENQAEASSVKRPYASLEKVEPRSPGTADTGQEPDSPTTLPDNQVANRIGGLFDDLGKETLPAVPAMWGESQNGERYGAIGPTDDKAKLDHSSPTIPALVSGLSYCPFLGLHNDQETRTSFPSPLNRCFRAEKPLPIEYAYQAKYCLANHYNQCRIYQRGLEGASHLEIGIDTKPRSKFRGRMLLLFGSAVLVVVSIVFVIAWLIR